ncbi:MAG: hypothetical protein WBR18_07080 [Anaerolineales bacterium]
MKRPLLVILLIVCLTTAQPAVAGAERSRLQAGSDYVQLELGDLPIVFSIPHGGDLRPRVISDRTEAVVVDDPGIRSFALDLADAIASKTGRRPSLVFNELHRTKLDPNRSLLLGAQGDPIANEAWRAYHQAIEDAADLSLALCGRGHVFDLHSHGEPGRWLEFGYGLSADDLDRPDEDLAKRRFVYQSNWRALASLSPDTLPELVRGADSLGGQMEEAGFWAVPSPEHPAPDDGYFDGGYSVYLHGSHRGGAIDATQIEVPYDLLQAPWRQRFTDSLAEAILGLMERSYGLNLAQGDSGLCPPFVDLDPADPFYAAVEALDRAGGAVACHDEPRRFCPTDLISREAAAELIWRALYPAALIPWAVEPVFSDVAEGAVGSNAAQKLWQQGFLGACDVVPLRYCPQARFSRADLAKLALKIRRGRAYLPPPPMDDTPKGARSEWGMWWVSEAIRVGLMDPCPPTDSARFCANGPVSRVELASSIAIALGLASPVLR